MAQDILIEQDTKVLVQKLVGMMGKDKSAINVISVGQVNLAPPPKSLEDRVHDLLVDIPPPRLENLINLVYTSMTGRFTTQAKLADFLGVSRRQMCYWTSKLKIDWEKKGDGHEIEAG